MAEHLGIHLILKTHPMSPLRAPGTSGRLTIWGDDDLTSAGLTLYELMGHAAVLVSDYSSAWVDYLLIDRPVVFSIADLDAYARSRGHYSAALPEQLPGPIAIDLDQLQSELVCALSEDPWAGRRRQLRAEHHEHLDAHSARRVTDEIESRLDRGLANRSCERGTGPRSTQRRDSCHGGSDSRSQ
jgi:CDP-glycerol glycerophosphotransferase (TagB/SpsB family)